MTGLVVGLGCRPGVTEADAVALVEQLLERHGQDRSAVTAYATVEARADEPGLRAVAGQRLRAFPAELLASVAVPNPSRRVSDAVGTPSVAEAAALCAARAMALPGSVIELIGEKVVGVGVTAALVRVS